MSVFVPCYICFWRSMNNTHQLQFDAFRTFLNVGLLPCDLGRVCKTKQKLRFLKKIGTVYVHPLDISFSWFSLGHIYFMRQNDENLRLPRKNWNAASWLEDRVIQPRALMSTSSHIRGVLIGVKYQNLSSNLDVYLLFVTQLGQI